MNKWAKRGMVLLMLGAFAAQVCAPQSDLAQTTTPHKKKPVHRRTTHKKATAHVPNKPVDTTAVAVKPVAKIPTLPIDTIRRSLRNDAAVERNLIKDRAPLAYQNIREDDAVYRQRVWAIIDTRQKMNLGFQNRTVEDNGSQQFIFILLNAIRDSSVVAFDPIDDRFTTPMPIEKIAEELVGKADTVKIIDPLTGASHDSVITEDFDPNSIIKFEIKEEYVFDKQSSRLYCRILGIAPIKEVIREDGTLMGETPLFWIYYPDLRPVLAKYEVYNGHNYGSRMSWEELFESHMFESYIVKSSIDNPYDRPISTYIKDPVLRLLEGDKIKEKIFDYEQDLWQY